MGKVTSSVYYEAGFYRGVLMGIIAKLDYAYPNEQSRKESIRKSAEEALEKFREHNE